VEKIEYVDKIVEKEEEEIIEKRVEVFFSPSGFLSVRADSAS
jgi:hypothetical protein